MNHIAILKQPFFDMVLNGEKTIESRWSMNRIAPYGKVSKGDLIFLKESGKQVTATARVADVKYFRLDPGEADEIRAKWGKEIGTDKFENWESIREKRFCTLIWLSDVTKIRPIIVPRSHGAGWIISGRK